MKLTQQDISNRVEAFDLLGKVTEISKEIRTKLLYKYTDMDCLGFMFSRELKQELDKLNIQSRLVEGTVKINDTPEYHVWLELKNYIVDNTLEQFSSKIPVATHFFLRDESFDYIPRNILNLDGSKLV